MTALKVTAVREALHAAATQALREMLPGAANTIRCEDSRPGEVLRGSLCVIRITGPLFGSLALACPPNAAKQLGRTLVETTLGPQPDEDSAGLTELEQSAVRELCNRMGGAFVMALPDPDSYRVAFPVFIDGPTARVGWRFPIRAGVTIHEAFDSLLVTAGFARAPQRCSSVSRIRSLDAMRAEVLAEDT